MHAFSLHAKYRGLGHGVLCEYKQVLNMLMRINQAIDFRDPLLKADCVPLSGRYKRLSNTGSACLYIPLKTEPSRIWDPLSCNEVCYALKFRLMQTI